jgi:hypothetical protein
MAVGVQGGGKRKSEFARAGYNINVKINRKYGFDSKSKKPNSGLKNLCKKGRT